jgi:hypothetical protein
MWTTAARCRGWCGAYGASSSASVGYISRPLAALLEAQELRLVKLRKDMRNKFLASSDKPLLRKRALIETVNDRLKNISQVEHTRHRSLWNFPGNVAAGLIAYTRREKKPSLNIQVKEQFLISN